jgi:hypothetical protein
MLSCLLKYTYKDRRGLEKMGCYNIPLNFHTIWKEGKKVFQVWNALYYLSQVRFRSPEFVITPYILKTPPFLITDIKQKSLLDILEKLSGLDDNICFDPDEYDQKGKFIVRLVLPKTETLSLPIEFVELGLFKGNILTLKEEVPALMFLCIVSEPSSWNSDIKPLFSFKGTDLENYICSFSSKKNRCKNTLNKLREKCLIDNTKFSSGGQVEGTITWPAYIKHNETICLKIDPGALDGTTQKYYDEMIHILRTGKNSSSCDYLLIAAALSCFEKTQIFQLNHTKPDSIATRITSELIGKSRKGRYSLINQFNSELLKHNIQAEWFDFSADSSNEQESKTTIIPDTDYNNALFIHYFYPGSLAEKNADKAAFDFCIELSGTDSKDFCRIKTGNEYKITKCARIPNAYRGAFLCKLNDTPGKFNQLKTSVKIVSGFKKLNLRTLVILVPNFLF